MMYYVLSIILTPHWKVPDAQNEWNKREEEPFVMSVGLFTTCPFGHLMPWCPKGWQNVLAYAMRHLPAISLAESVPTLFHHLGIGLSVYLQWRGWKRCWCLVFGVVNKIFSLASGELDSNSHSAWQMALPFDPSQFLTRKIGLSLNP